MPRAVTTRPVASHHATNCADTTEVRRSDRRDSRSGAERGWRAGESRCQHDVFGCGWPTEAADLVVRLHQPCVSTGAGCRHADAELDQCRIEGRPRHQERHAHRTRRPESRQSYLDFTNAAIADFVVPGFDGSSKAANTFTVEAAISKSMFRAGDNAPIQPSIKSKPFLPSNFRLSIDGLPTTRVRLIAPISFRRTTGGIAPTDLVVTFSSTDVGPWRAWVDDFIVKGNNGQGKEKQGLIEVMAPICPTSSRRSR
jgi:hypothetical protein